MTQMTTNKKMALGNDNSIIIEGVNDTASICTNRNCKFKYNKCNKMHDAQINECLDLYSLTNNINRTQRLAYRMKYDFNIKKKEILVDGTKFNSAGVLLFNEDNIYLFQNASIILTKINRGCYYSGMTKGRIEKKDKMLEMTASREVYEESCKTIFIPPEILQNNTNDKYVDIEDYKKNYRIYFCEMTENIPSILNYYINNLENISDTQDNATYHETNQMYIFNIKNIIDKIKNKDFYKLKPESFSDINGETHIIDRKTIQVIFKFNEQNKSTIKLNKYNIINGDITSTISFIKNE